MENNILNPREDQKLTDSQKEYLSNIIERVLYKYIKISEIKNFDDPYYEGITDGLNHAYKIINNIEDDYLDGI